MCQLLAHGLSRDIEPARGFGLVALREFNGPGEELSLDGFDHGCMRVGECSLPGGIQELIGVRAGICLPCGDGLEVVHADGKTSGRTWPGQACCCSHRMASG